MLVVSTPSAGVLACIGVLQAPDQLLAFIHDLELMVITSHVPLRLRSNVLTARKPPTSSVPPFPDLPDRNALEEATCGPVP